MDKTPNAELRCCVCGKVIDDAADWLRELVAEYPHIISYRCVDCWRKDDDYDEGRI